MKQAVIQPFAGKLVGSILCPRDKSLSHRAVMLGTLSEGETVITGFSFCRDCLATVYCIQSWGVEVELIPQEEKVIVRSEGLFHLREPHDVLNAENSGTTIRLLAGMATGIPGLSVFTGDQSLRQRPMGRIIEPLRQTGVEIGGRAGDRFPPLFVRGQSRVKPIRHTLPVPSAQVKSALILAALKGEGPSVIDEPVASRDHTENMLRYLGASIKKQGTTIVVNPCTQLHAKAFRLPGDASSAAFLVALATLCPDSQITIKDVGVNPHRIGFLHCLRMMGGKWRLTNEHEEFGEARADLEVEFAPLRGIEIPPELIPSLIDEIPILSILASQAEGKTVISGAEELRVKESDRIAAIAQGLKALGGRVEEKRDGLIIYGKTTFTGGVVESFGDHRIAMSFIIAGLTGSKTVVVKDVDCIEISYPRFFTDLATLGCSGVSIEEK